MARWKYLYFPPEQMSVELEMELSPPASLDRKGTNTWPEDQGSGVGHRREQSMAAASQEVSWWLGRSSPCLPAGRFGYLCFQSPVQTAFWWGCVITGISVLDTFSQLFFACSVSSFDIRSKAEIAAQSWRKTYYVSLMPMQPSSLQLPLMIPDFLVLVAIFYVWTVWNVHLCINMEDAMFDSLKTVCSVCAAALELCRGIVSVLFSY